MKGQENFDLLTTNKYVKLVRKDYTIYSEITLTEIEGDTLRVVENSLTILHDEEDRSNGIIKYQDDNYFTLEELNDKEEYNFAAITEEQFKKVDDVYNNCLTAVSDLIEDTPKKD